MGARNAPDKPDSGSPKKHTLAAALSLGSALLLWLAFPPVDFGLIAWVALVPWLVMVGRSTPGRIALWSAVAGCAFFVASLHWLRFVTIAGWLALAFYCAAYWPAAGLLIRWLRKRGVPPALTAPLLWTALEFVRAHLLTGFPFFFIGHTQYRFLTMIQIADLTGVYGITFVILLVNGCLAGLILDRECRPRRVLLHGGVALAVLLLTMAYGTARVRTKRPHAPPGPKICLVQANVPLDLKHSPSLEEHVRVLKRHAELTIKAVTEHDPDLVIWPETMVPAPINQMWDEELIRRTTQLPDKEKYAGYKEYGNFLATCRNELRGALALSATHILAGAEYQTLDQPPKRCNSAYLLSPSGAIMGRYDKIHLVTFGEYTPLRNTFPFLSKFRPAVMGPDMSAGRLRHLFRLPSDHDGQTAFGVTICYEDAEAGLFREFVRKGAEFMVNITNDGWFRDSSELDVHLAVCVFRAVENRVPIARCANTGISALIEPTGRIASRIASAAGKCREVEGTLTDVLRPRRGHALSLYTKHGDVFAWLCVAGTLAMILLAALRPQRPLPRKRPVRDDATRKRKTRR